MTKLKPTLEDVVVLNNSGITTAVTILSEKIDGYYELQGIEEIILVPLLTGAVYFASDLSRALSTIHEVHPIKVSSYVGTEQHHVKHALDLSMDYRGKHILIVDEICDSGTTLDTMKKVFYALGASTVRVVVLIDRPLSRKQSVESGLINWSGVVIEDPRFLYGYGLDLDEKYRNLNRVMALNK